MMLVVSVKNALHLAVHDGLKRDRIDKETL